MVVSILTVGYFGIHIGLDVWQALDGIRRVMNAGTFILNKKGLKRLSPFQSFFDSSV